MPATRRACHARPVDAQQNWRWVLNEVGAEERAQGRWRPEGIHLRRNPGDVDHRFRPRAGRVAVLTGPADLVGRGSTRGARPLRSPGTAPVRSRNRTWPGVSASQVSGASAVAQHACAPLAGIPVRRRRPFCHTQAGRGTDRGGRRRQREEEDEDGESPDHERIFPEMKTLVALDRFYTLGNFDAQTPRSTRAQHAQLVRCTLGAPNTFDARPTLIIYAYLSGYAIENASSRTRAGSRPGSLRLTFPNRGPTSCP